MAPRYERYERVYHRHLREYGHLIAPGPSGGTVMLAVGGAPHFPAQRKHLRRLRWWERLLNR